MLFNKLNHQMTHHRFNQSSLGRQAESYAGYGWFLVATGLLAIFIVLSNLGIAS